MPVLPAMAHDAPFPLETASTNSRPSAPAKPPARTSSISPGSPRAEPRSRWTRLSAGGHDPRGFPRGGGARIRFPGAPASRDPPRRGSRSRRPSTETNNRGLPPVSRRASASRVERVGIRSPSPRGAPDSPPPPTAPVHRAAHAAPRHAREAHGPRPGETPRIRAPPSRMAAGDRMGASGRSSAAGISSRRRAGPRPPALRDRTRDEDAVSPSVQKSRSCR